MKQLAIRLLTYPVLIILTLIFVGPTIPFDLSILLITTIFATMGFSEKTDALGLRAYLAAWRAKIFGLWNLERTRQ
jgi:hypothetical protein